MLFTANTNHTRKIVGVWLLLLTSIIVFAAYLDVYESPRTELEILTTLNWLFVAVLLSNTLPKGSWSICFIFYVSFGIFHGGLVLANSLGSITDDDTLYQISFWFNKDATSNAIHLINLAFLGFGLGALIFSKPPEVVANPPKIDVEYNRRLYHFGGLFLTAMTILFFVVAFATGALFSYGAYLAIVDTNPAVGIIFTYIYVFIGLSLVFIAVTYQQGFGYRYFIVFAIWSIFAFKLGLRGEVMFPGAVAACMLGRKGRPINGFILLIAVCIFLILAGIVKNARISGDYSTGASFNPMNAIAEMGSSLRAVQEVVTWRINGDELMLGASYWAPIERQLALILPQMERIDAAEDYRLLNVTVIKRAGPIGFSPVAEAYINFGESGVFVIFILFGSLFAYFDSQVSSTKYDLLLGVSLIPIFIMIRNSFAHVPVQIIIGQIVTVTFMFLAKRKKAL
jgi:hypothetical protein